MDETNNICRKIKELRIRFHLSQDYVAKYLKINRSTYTQMENGNRKITAEEITRLSELFGTTTDTILKRQEEIMPSTIFARSFEELDEADQKEIMNLIQFKKQMKEQRNK